MALSPFRRTQIPTGCRSVCHRSRCHHSLDVCQVLHHCVPELLITTTREALWEPPAARETLTLLPWEELGVLVEREADRGTRSVSTLTRRLLGGQPHARHQLCLLPVLTWVIQSRSARTWCSDSWPNIIPDVSVRVFLS